MQARTFRVGREPTLNGGRATPTTTAAVDPKRSFIERQRANEHGELGQFPRTGVYAVVTASGSVRTGDPVVRNRARQTWVRCSARACKAILSATMGGRTVHLRHAGLGLTRPFQPGGRLGLRSQECWFNGDRADESFQEKIMGGRRCRRDVEYNDGFRVCGGERG